MLSSLELKFSDRRDLSSFSKCFLYRKFLRVSIAADTEDATSKGGEMK